VPDTVPWLVFLSGAPEKTDSSEYFVVSRAFFFGATATANLLLLIHVEDESINSRHHR
jgi:hypothetical protein